MGAAFFYHLTRVPLEGALPGLIERALAKGWRVAVRGRSEVLVERLDLALWQPPDSFLPHGLAGGPRDADQPVLLTTTPALPNGAQCLMSVEGAAVAAEEVAGLERACVLFDGAEAAALETARAQWRGLCGAGLRAEYWRQEPRGWTCAAVSGGTD